MGRISFRWFFERRKKFVHLQQAPLWQFSIFLTGAFLLFSVIGFYVDLMNGGTDPYSVVILHAILSGLNATLWIVVIARLPPIFILLMLAKELFVPSTDYGTQWLRSLIHPPPVPGAIGIHFAGTSILILVIASYVCFSLYVRITGYESFRLKAELQLAHSIQKTLVPLIERQVGPFEIYGISYPSEKVGGDLVDVVELGNGDGIAYLADIAGHGLQAGILMGMLKTAARTALAGEQKAGGPALSMLMDRLNSVLPQVKEAHMYATFTALRLNLDGGAFYGMAASPPLLHWSAATGSIARIEEQQFPLGLLPVANFPSSKLIIEPGDLIVIATDGILEVDPRRKQTESKDQPQFGVTSMEALINSGARLPLPQLAEQILQAVRSYGTQLDDQTLLLVRRSPSEAPRLAA